MSSGFGEVPYLTSGFNWKEKLPGGIFELLRKFFWYHADEEEFSRFLIDLGVPPENAVKVYRGIARKFAGMLQPGTRMDAAAAAKQVKVLEEEMTRVGNTTNGTLSMSVGLTH
jgi:hypothetical protein